MLFVLVSKFKAHSATLLMSFYIHVEIEKNTKLNTSQVHQGVDHNNCICGKDVLDLPDTQTSMVNPISPTGVRGN